MHFARGHFEEAIVFAPARDDLVEVLTVRIRDEDLPEVTPSDQTNNALHTLSIELVEDIIQEEQRALGVGRREQGILGELQRDEEGLILPLAPDLANELFAKEHLQVVLVQPHSRIAHEAVTLTGLTLSTRAIASSSASDDV